MNRFITVAFAIFIANAFMSLLYIMWLAGQPSTQAGINQTAKMIIKNWK